MKGRKVDATQSSTPPSGSGGPPSVGEVASVMCVRLARAALAYDVFVHDARSGKGQDALPLAECAAAYRHLSYGEMDALRARAEIATEAKRSGNL